MRFSLGFGCAVVVLVSSFISRIEAAPSKGGMIEVASVAGSVVDGKSKAIKAGQMLSSGDAVITGEDGRAALVFSNGTKVVVEPQTNFSVTRFLQDPFDPAGKDLAALKKEPTVSTTELAVQKGSIVTDVAKLDPKSTMEVKTPLGTAGIRGTKFRITVAPEPGGGFRVSLRVLEGRVEFQKLDGQNIVVAPGTETDEITLSVKSLEDAQAQLTEGTMSDEDRALLEQALVDAFGPLSTDGSGFGGDQGASAVGTLNNMGGGGGGGGTPNAPNPPSPYNN